MPFAPIFLCIFVIYLKKKQKIIHNKFFLFNAKFFQSKPISFWSCQTRAVPSWRAAGTAGCAPGVAAFVTDPPTASWPPMHRSISRYIPPTLPEQIAVKIRHWHMWRKFANFYRNFFKKNCAEKTLQMPPDLQVPFLLVHCQRFVHELGEHAADDRELATALQHQLAGLFFFWMEKRF